MLLFELSGPNVVSISNFSSISLQMADFSLFFGAKFCEVSFVILLPCNELVLLVESVLTLSGPAFAVIRQARGGGLRGPDAKNQG